MKKLAPISALITRMVPSKPEDMADTGPLSDELIFVSDTQQPMWVEQILLRSHNNKKATANILARLLHQKPKNLYMLGDIVSLGYSGSKWKKVDVFLDSCHRQGTAVSGIMGNHDVMGRRKKGEKNFQKRFPLHVRTGYVSITDSVAIVMLNSNFGTLTAEDEEVQKNWYLGIMAELDASDDVKAVIVCCHHSPFTNSKIVSSNKKVQQQFVPGYLNSQKAQLFLSGHAHAFEHFKLKGKDFLVIGGGGGLHQPLRKSLTSIEDFALHYKPRFHYLSVKRVENNLLVTSHFLRPDFTDFDTGISFSTGTPASNETNPGDAS
ncbi:MAG: metallophosphoesterase [Bacteroidota bacterium]